MSGQNKRLRNEKKQRTEEQTKKTKKANKWMSKRASERTDGRTGKFILSKQKKNEKKKINKQTNE